MISVCMATYNGERFIEQQLGSILSQLNPDDEIVISDDGSSDSTVAIINSQNDSRIKLYHNPGEKGINHNFEHAISHAKGDIIFLADQDDVWNEGKIESCKNALKEYDCIVHDCVVTDSILHPTSPSLLGLIDGKSGFCHNIIRNGFTGCCMCFKKEMTKHFMPFPKKVDFFYDQWIGLRIEMKGKTLFLRKALMNFRRHDDASSSASVRSRRSILKQISSRLSLITNLFLFDLKAHS